MFKDLLIGDDVMAHYIVTFFKHLLSSDGHQFKAPQEKIAICADSPEQAVEAAHRRFASIRHIPSWRHHADVSEVATDCTRTVNVTGQPLRSSEPG
jgi:hypothetical protein